MLAEWKPAPCAGKAEAAIIAEARRADGVEG